MSEATCALSDELAAALEDLLDVCYQLDCNEDLPVDFPGELLHKGTAALVKYRARRPEPADTEVGMTIGELADLWPKIAKPACDHEHLDMDGICHKCGEDCRGAH